VTFMGVLGIQFSVVSFTRSHAPAWEQDHCETASGFLFLIPHP
jgi:hypothetical protein